MVSLDQKNGLDAAATHLLDEPAKSGEVASAYFCPNRCVEKIDCASLHTLKYTCPDL